MPSPQRISVIAPPTTAVRQARGRAPDGITLSGFSGGSGTFTNAPTGVAGEGAFGTGRDMGRLHSPGSSSHARTRALLR